MTMKGITSKSLSLLVVLCVCTALISCSKKVETGIPVGQFGSLTGAQATFGESSDKGVLLALDEINATGGVLGQQIRLITKDNQSKPGETSTVVRELITRNKVVALIGEVASGRSLEAAPIAQRSCIPMISPSSTSEKVTESGDHIFRVCFIDPFQGKVCAKFARGLGISKIAILTDVSKDYSMGLTKSFKAEFPKGGGVITGEQSYSGGDKDFSAQLTAIKAGNPQAIFLPAYYTDAPLIIRQARQLDQSREPRAAAGAEVFQAVLHEQPVFVDEWHHIGDGGEGRQADGPQERLAESRGDAARTACPRGDRPGQLEGHAGAAEAAEWVGGAGEPGMHEHVSGGKFVGEVVVVGDDQFQTQIPRP
jgi:hypothetical protein